MNLSELCDRVADTLQYAPDLLTYERDIRRVVTEEYHELCLERDWPWLITTEPIWVFPDIELERTDLAYVGPRALNINAALLEGVLYQVNESDSYEAFQQNLAGAEFDVLDPDTAPDGVVASVPGNWSQAPFTIENVAPARVSSVTFWLDQRASIDSLSSNGPTDFVIRFRRTRLPPRCQSYIALVDDQNRPLTTIPPGLFRDYMQDPDQTGADPLYVLPDGGFDSRNPTYVTGPGAAFAGAEELRQVRNQPVYDDPPFVATATNTSSTLLGSTTYRVFVCWTYGNRYGPPSSVVSVTTTSVNKCIALSALPQTATAAGIDSFGDTGRRLAVFISEGDHGPYFEYSKLTTGFATTLNITERPTAAKVLGDRNWLRRWDDVYPQGPYQYIRLWPRPTETKRLLLTYVRRPRQLIHDTDEPELPEPFQKILVHRAVVSMGLRFNAGSRLVAAQEVLLEKGMQALYNRFLPGAAIRPRKGLLGSMPNGPIHPTSINFGD